MTEYIVFTDCIANHVKIISGSQEKEKELHGGIFAHESNRISENGSGKRKAQEMDADIPTKDIWSEFENIMMSSGGNRGDMYTQSAGMVDVNSVI